jgi:tetratricopeptide (TPR) repeat protein
MTTGKPYVLRAIDALRQGDRDAAVSLLQQDLATEPPGGARWKSVSMLAANIGALEISLEAARRYACTQPASLEHLLHYWGELAAAGRSEIARSELERLSANQRAHPTVLHFEGTLAGEEGDFEGATQFYRRALATTPVSPQTWFALAMIKRFTGEDPDLATMERLRPAIAKAPPATHARFLYGLAKAWHDTGDTDRAFGYYAQGAALRRAEERYDRAQMERASAALIRQFQPDSLRQLTPSGASDRRVVFVNGLPRSGTTLIEQILASHSEVADGAELNLFRAALIPTRDFSWDGALAYQQRSPRADPWGDIGRTYFAMLEARFRTRSLVVDKTLSQSHFMGLLLHTLPSAKVLWLRRAPEDVALSCYRNFFTSQIPWSWSFEDIGHYFRMEDQLFEHWTRLFPDRILVVPYEELVRAPDSWIARILDHAGLNDEPQVYRFHETRRSVRTASVSQVRAPIATDRIGISQGYARHMEAFNAAYRG